MKLVIVIFLLFSLSGSAKRLFPAFPFIQRTENGTIICRSIPYDVYGLTDLGETTIYQKGKVLYKVDKYFNKPFFTTESGKFLIEISPKIYYRMLPIEYDTNGKQKENPVTYDGSAIKIYEKGRLKHEFKFSQFNIDTSAITINRKVGWFSWIFQLPLKNDIENTKANLPFYYKGDTLFFIGSNQNLISISISKGKVLSNAPFDMKTKTNTWNVVAIKREYQIKDYPEQFSLPKLASGASLEQGLAKYLNKNAVSKKENAIYQVYIYTLLLDSRGKCERAYVSAVKRESVSEPFGFKDDVNLVSVIEKWLEGKVYNTDLVPKGFPKYKFADFVYLKE
jgi:hypothetical protein